MSAIKPAPIFYYFLGELTSSPPLLKRGYSYGVQCGARSLRWVPAADRHCGSLHRRAGHVLPFGSTLYRHFILCYPSSP